MANPTKVQDKFATGSGSSSLTASWTSTPTSGNLLIAMVHASITGGTPAINNITGWTELRAQANSANQYNRVFYKIAGSSETGITATFGGTTFTSTGVMLIELAGANVTTVGQVIGAAGGANNGTSLTTVANGGLLHGPYADMAGLQLVGLGGTPGATFQVFMTSPSVGSYSPTGSSLTTPTLAYTLVAFTASVNETESIAASTWNWTTGRSGIGSYVALLPSAISPTASDTGSGADSASVTFVSALTASDSSNAPGAEATDLSVNINQTEVVGGVDVASSSMEMGAADTGRVSDSASAVIPMVVNASDSGTATESWVIPARGMIDFGYGFDQADVKIFAAYFTPPVIRDMPNYLPEDRSPNMMLWRHYQLRERGVNVYLLSDGTYAQETATPGHTSTNIPLPWILNDPRNEFSYVTNWDGSVTQTFLDPHVVKVYEGGHTHPVTSGEAQSLAGAGYVVDYV